MKKIGLAGFSGSGKSSLAEIAKRSGLLTADTDALLIERYGLNEFLQIIDGDDTDFRSMESEVIADALNSDAQMVAFGGGFHAGHKAFGDAVSSGIRLIYLRTSFDEIRDRIKDRPLFKKLGMEKYRSLFEERMSLYAGCADFTVDAGERSLKELWIEVEKIWNLIFR
jgi:shikimate kinase